MTAKKPTDYIKGEHAAMNQMQEWYYLMYWSWRNPDNGAIEETFSILCERELCELFDGDVHREIRLDDGSIAVILSDHQTWTAAHEALIANREMD